MNYYQSHIRTSAPLPSLPRILSSHTSSPTFSVLSTRILFILIVNTVIYIHFSTQDLFRMRFNCQYSIFFTY